MHLAKISVQGFRCLKNVSIDLNAGLNVLVGRNNTGKTALLAALRLALGPSSSRSDAVWLTEDDFTREGIEPRASKIEVDLRFEGLSEKQRAQFFEIVEFDVDHPEKSTASVRFEASWPPVKKVPTIRRWGGPPHPDHPQVPQEILERLPVTFLPALRDAEAALTPGNRSRLALLLKDLARRQKVDQKNLVEIFTKANKQLTDQSFIRALTNDLRQRARDMSGSDYQEMSVAAADPEFERILRTLCITMDGSPLSSITSNGLGYNNLLYIATVLLHLSDSDEDECPILLVEEPEAHLHPQLTLLLGQFLGNKRRDTTKIPQAIITTHSPMLASSVQPNRIHVLFRKPESGEIACNSIAKTGLDEHEERALQRMMDVARSTLYFCKGLILVEGISEALIIPTLATQLGRDLASNHVAVLPICGVAFRTFQKLFSENGLGIPVAFITDGDPPVCRSAAGWEQDTPQRVDGGFVLSERTQDLLRIFDKHKTVLVTTSQLTLEYDLAAAGCENPDLMVTVWESCFSGKPRTLNAERLAQARRDKSDLAMVVWRGICRADHTGTKADFAHKLAERIQNDVEAGSCTFAVPNYIRLAVDHVLPPVPRGEEDPWGAPDLCARSYES